MTITEPAATEFAGDVRATYRCTLASLRDTGSGEVRALILDCMAAQAGTIASATYGNVPADSCDSSLAWEMTAVLLRQLAASQRGMVLHMVGEFLTERWDSANEWEDLARASSSREFGAAFAVLYVEFLGELAYQDKADRAASSGDPASTAMARLADAARAISEADWQSPAAPRATR